MSVSRFNTRPITWMARQVLRIIDMVVPKDGTWVVTTFPEFDDTSRGIWQALTKDQRSQVYWLAEHAPVWAVTEHVRYHRSRSLKGLWRFFRASVVIHSHGVHGSMVPSRRKLMVNVWHGMPIKRLDPGSDVGHSQTDLTIATSEIHATNLQVTWNLRPDQVLVCGLPRNDVLLRESTLGPTAKLSELHEKPIVVWLPTYRRSVVGHIRMDGVEHGNPFQLPDATEDRVQRMAENLGIHLIVKVHPMARPPHRSSFANLSLWTDGDLARHDTSLYRLLSHADLLITDYSSVWIDWLLLDRPCVFSIADLTEYERTRGTYFEPLEAYLPGPTVSNMDDLEDALRGELSQGQYSDARRASKRLHHTHDDAQSAPRLVNALERLLADDQNA